MALTHLPRNDGFSLRESYLGDLGERNMCTGRCRKGQAANGFEAATGLCVKACRDIVRTIIDEDLRDRISTDAGLDQGHDVGDVDAQSCRGDAVHIDAKLG